VKEPNSSDPGRRGRRRWLHRLLWCLPLGILPVVTLCALLAWCMTTPSGSRWVLTTGATVVGLKIQTVNGTLWHGLRIGRVQWTTPTLSLHAQDLTLRVDWRFLWEVPQKHLRIPEITLQNMQLRWTEKTAYSVALQNISASLTLDAQGQGSFTLHDARWPDGGQIRATLAGQIQASAARINGTLKVEDLHLPSLLQTLLAANVVASDDILTAQIGVAAHWQETGEPAQLSIRAHIAPPSRWRGQPVQANILMDGQADGQTLLSNARPWWHSLNAVNLDVNASLAQHAANLTGRLAQENTRLNFAANINDLSALWPDWRGNVQVDGQLESEHAQHVWRGHLNTLALDVDGWQFEAQTPLTAHVKLASAHDVQWRLDAFTARLAAADKGASEHVERQVGASEAPKVFLTLKHEVSTGSTTHLHMQGAVELAPSVLPAALVRAVPAHVYPFDLKAQRQRVHSVETPLHQVALNATVKHDKLGQSELTAHASLAQSAANGWRLQAPLTWQIQADMPDLRWLNTLAGETVELDGRLQARLHGSVDPGRAASPSWDVSGTLTGERLRILRLDDGVRLLDGTLKARLENRRVTLEHLRFPATRRVNPRHARLAAWLQNDAAAQGGYLDLSGSWPLVWPLDGLSGKTPHDNAQNDNAKGASEQVQRQAGATVRDACGAVTCSEASKEDGINITLHRYPILQRSDRYAMVSGTLHLALPAVTTLPLALTLSGAVKMDAGWVDLDALSSVPTLDSDVVIVRASQSQTPSQATRNNPLSLTMTLQLDPGQRFYLTGYGVDTRLTGALNLSLQDNTLSARGELHPLDDSGTVSAYGQTLQLRQDSRISFESDLANPQLNIEAVRSGTSIQAGVRVAGTPTRPRIDLISYPEVNDVEKLAWLLFGRSADESGGDAALLLSVGSSFLFEGEPFYRRFGVDEVGMRSGSLGSAGSVLPVEGVVRGFGSGTSEIERKFIVASKRLHDSLSASVEQALSDTGTVGRLSWRLGRGLSIQLAGGTVNGLALIYHWVMQD